MAETEPLLGGIGAYLHVIDRLGSGGMVLSPTGILRLEKTGGSKKIHLRGICGRDIHGRVSSEEI